MRNEVWVRVEFGPESVFELFCANIEPATKLSSRVITVTYLNQVSARVDYVICELPLLQVFEQVDAKVILKIDCTFLHVR